MLLRANVMVFQNDDDLKKIWFARFYKKAKVIFEDFGEKTLLLTFAKLRIVE